MDSLAQQIIEIVKKISRTNDVSLDSHLIDQLGIDSLAFIRLVIELETKFDLHIEDQDLNMLKFPFVHNIYDYLSVQMESKKVKRSNSFNEVN